MVLLRRSTITVAVIIHTAIMAPTIPMPTGDIIIITATTVMGIGTITEETHDLTRDREGLAVHGLVPAERLTLSFADVAATHKSMLLVRRLVRPNPIDRPNQWCDVRFEVAHPWLVQVHNQQQATGPHQQQKG